MGCSCQPSPALTTDRVDPVGDTCQGAPAERVAHDDGVDAHRPRWSATVSRSDSPFFTDDVPTLKVIVSAERRLAAVSNESRVRVESS